MRRWKFKAVVAAGETGWILVTRRWFKSWKLSKLGKRNGVAGLSRSTRRIEISLFLFVGYGCGGLVVCFLRASAALFA